MPIDYGPLRSLFNSEEISEIMVNSWNKIFVEHEGLLVETSVKFVDQRQFEELIYSILAADKKNLASALSFDGTLPGGERYNITLPPLTSKGPTITIRKFFAQNLTFEDLVQKQFLSDKAAHFLKVAVASRISIVISGGTGSGKTSFLNTLSGAISKTERVISIEDVAELRLNHPNWISMQSVDSERIKLNAKSCLINALRMRPDRIIVGECRKDETFEMLQAMNMGHDGSMTTIHANSANDCLSRLESLIQLNGVELPLKQIRFLMSKAIGLVAQIRRRADGVREIVDITEIIGMENDVMTRACLFERDRSGQLVPTGLVPHLLKKINANGQVILHSFFDERSLIKKPA